MSNAPLYARLPRGPHGLGRRAVLLNQRERIQGAIVEAVAEHGYEHTSVKQVVALAGVSRRAFYEQFANREDCFLATFDAIAARALARTRAAYAHAGGSHERRVQSAIGSFAALVERHPQAGVLAACEAETAGRRGLAHVRRACAAFERSFAEALVDPAAPTPRPIVRGLVGGLHAILAARLVHPRAAPQELEAELFAWARAFTCRVPPAFAAHLAREAAAALRTSPARLPAPQRPHAAGADPRRLALQHAALRLAVVGDYRELTPARIADEAGAPIEQFLGAFADRDACYAAALDQLAAGLLAALQPPGVCAEPWPALVRGATGALLALLAAQPLYAHTIARGAFAAGAPAARRNRALAREVALRLLCGAPVPIPAHVVEGLAGALWHTIGCQVAAGRAQLLPALREHLAYLVLVPVLGAETAARALTAPTSACDG
jgi:AcrR family transcriptional regulator